MPFRIFKNTFTGLYLLVISLFMNGEVLAQTGDNLIKEKIDAIFEPWNLPGSPGCAVGIFQDSRLLFSHGYGYAVLDGDNSVPISPETVFYSGSLSKQFTAAAIALLHLQGKLDINNPIRKYIPEFPQNENKWEPTVSQLVHHTGGVAELYSLLRLYGISLDEVVPFQYMVETVIGQSHLNFKPGSEYLYSNGGYTLLAEIVNRVSGKTLRDYTKENLFKPLAMHHTHFHDDRNHEISNKALSYESRGGEFRLSYLENFEGVGPGGLYTTIEDFIKWDQQLSENRLENANDFNRLMHEVAVLNNGVVIPYAFGLRISEYKGQKTVGHGGSFMGFKSNYLRFPEHGFSTVLLCNLNNIQPGELNNRIADVFLRAPIKVWKERFVGNYYSEALDLELMISLQNGELYLHHSGSPSGVLKYQEKSSFTSGSWVFEFKETEKGNLNEFKLSTGRLKNVIFRRSL
jgi:CubicO group peptidase (beta-lactamase class C family)